MQIFHLIRETLQLVEVWLTGARQRLPEPSFNVPPITPTDWERYSRNYQKHQPHTLVQSLHPTIYHKSLWYWHWSNCFNSWSGKILLTKNSLQLLTSLWPVYSYLSIFGPAGGGWGSPRLPAAIASGLGWQKRHLSTATLSATISGCEKVESIPTLVFWQVYLFKMTKLYPKHLWNSRKYFPTDVLAVQRFSRYIMERFRTDFKPFFFSWNSCAVWRFFLRPPPGIAGALKKRLVSFEHLPAGK